LRGGHLRRARLRGRGRVLLGTRTPATHRLDPRRSPPPGTGRRVSAHERDVMHEPIPVAIHFKSPGAYLAIAPPRPLEERPRPPFGWLPVSVPALIRPDPATTSEDRGTRHRRIRAEYVADDLRRYAATRGLELGDVYRQPDTTAAALGLLWLRHRKPA